MAVGQLLSEIKHDFPQAPLQPPCGRDWRDGRCLSPRPTHTQCVNTAAACVAEAGRKTGLSTLQSSSHTSSSQPPDLLTGNILGTSSLCQSPPSQEINTQSHCGNGHRSTNMWPRNSSSKQLLRGPQWEALPAFLTQRTMKALATVNFSELRNSCPGHPVPNSLGQKPYAEFPASGVQGSQPCKDQTLLSQPNHSCWLVHCLPLAPGSPPGKLGWEC